MRVWKVMLDLPDDLCTEIGRVITAHAYLEFALTRTICLLLDIDLKAGRLAVRDTRAAERLEAVFDLAILNGLAIDKDHTKALRVAVEKASSERNELAHGVWFEGEGGQPHLRNTKGSWQPRGTEGKVKRAVKPEGRPYGAPECHALHEHVLDTARLVDATHDALEKELKRRRACAQRAVKA
jgi:hypothetical protein